MLLGVALVAALAGAYVAWGFLADGLSGGALLARRVEDDRVPLLVNETRVRNEMPGLARLLDAAAGAGWAEAADEDLKERGVSYLRALARETSGRDFYAPPHNGVLAWKGVALEVSAYVA